MEKSLDELRLKKLICPECGASVLSINVDEHQNITVIIFKCLFSATFDRGVQPEEAQKRLDQFKSSGKMLEWLKKPLFADAITEARRKNAIRDGCEVV